MTRDLAHIAARAFNTPLLIHPRKAMVIASVLAEHMSGVLPMVDTEEARVEAETGREGRSQMLDRFDGERRGPKVQTDFGAYTQTRYLFSRGTALITVEGSLVNRGAYIGASSGVTSYEGVMAQLASAAADREVEDIIVDFDTPGGEATGAFEMAAFIRAIAAEKPVYAIVNGMAASAGYAMASGARRIITTESGMSGSIGVVMLHLDQSRKLDKMGVSPTLIYAGGHKVDGNPFEPLPDAVRADLQGEVDHLFEMFVSTVAQGRRGLSGDAIRATEARTYIGAAAVAAGLADDVGTLPGLVESLRGRQGGRVQSRSFSMDTISLADHTAAVSAARSEGLAEGLGLGAAAERARIQAIIGCDEAKGREMSAQHLAFNTTMCLDDAKAVMSGLAIASAAPAPGARMARVETPAIKPDATRERDTQAEADASWSAIAADLNKRAGL